MLDIDGFVSETNATNIFMVKNGVLLTPHADHCLPGITRETVMLVARELGIEVVERRISLSEFHSADEVFTTGACVRSCVRGCVRACVRACVRRCRLPSVGCFCRYAHTNRSRVRIGRDST